MGFFDKIFSSVPSEYSFSPKNEQEAFIGVMVACMSADGDISEVEIDHLLRILVFKTYFKNHDLILYYKNCLVAQKKVGSQKLIDGSVSKISADKKPTLFALIMELLLSDGILAQKEKDIAEYLISALGLSEEVASKIIEVMLIKNKDNSVIV